MQCAIMSRLLPLFRIDVIILALPASNPRQPLTAPSTKCLILHLADTFWQGRCFA